MKNLLIMEREKIRGVRREEENPRIMINKGGKEGVSGWRRNWIGKGGKAALVKLNAANAHNI